MNLKIAGIDEYDQAIVQAEELEGNWPQPSQTSKRQLKEYVAAASRA